MNTNDPAIATAPAIALEPPPTPVEPPQSKPRWKAIVRSCINCAVLLAVALLIVFPLVIPCGLGSHGATRSEAMTKAERLADMERIIHADGQTDHE